jgi:cytochrome c oxidase subunit 4
MSHDAKHVTKGDAKQDAAHGAAHAHETHHPTGNQYLKIAIILTIITAIEVWAYYIPALVASPLFNPALIIMSALKFGIVVLFYMHIKFDHPLFRLLFTASLILALCTGTALMFLFKVF